MISYREKEMLMVMKFLSDHSNDFAEQLVTAHGQMGDREHIFKLTDTLPNVSDYDSLVKYVKNQGYGVSIRIEDLLSEEELTQLEKEYSAIEEEFKKQTSLNKTDAVFIIIAIVLQMTRQFLQPSVNFEALKRKEDRESHDVTASKAKKSVYDKDKANTIRNRAEGDKTKGSKYYHASVKEIADIAHVPYDVINGTKKFNVKLSGTNHRAKTLGHDPWLGYIFGTCNILTNTMSLGKDNTFRTLHIGKDEAGRPSVIAEANPIKMFKYSAERYKESKATIVLAVIKQFYHIKSDEYSKEGLSLPFLQLFFDSDIIQELCESGIDYAKLEFLQTVATQATLAEVINLIISVVHRMTIVLEENNKNNEIITKEQLSQLLKKNASLTEVRTRKVIIISESIASTVNAGIGFAAAYTGNEDLARKVDIGGYISTVFHLFSDIRFITKIKKDFISKSIEENYQKKLKQIQ